VFSGFVFKNSKNPEAMEIHIRVNDNCHRCAVNRLSLLRYCWDKGVVSIYPDYRYNQNKLILFGNG
jgi:hypothetical protein